MKKLKEYVSPPKAEKMLQAKVDAQVLEDAHKAAKVKKLKFKVAVEIALKMFIDQAKVG